MDKAPRFIPFLLIFSLAGCNGPEPSVSAATEPTGQHPVPSIDDTDTTKDPEDGAGPPPQPEASVVVDAADGEVSPLDAFLVSFSGDIDPADLEQISMKRFPDMETVPIAVEYVASERKALIKPVGEWAGKTLLLYLGKVIEQDVDVSKIDPQNLSGMHQDEGGPLPVVIRTREYHQKRTIKYRDGEVDDYGIWIWHPEGTVWYTQSHFGDPGSDLSWFDDDDVQRSHYETTIDGRKASIKSTINHGGDETFGNDNDIVTAQQMRFHAPGTMSASEVNSRDPGEDKVWFTVDDDYGRFDVGRFDASERLETRAILSSNDVGDIPAGPGNDEEWFTSDDLLSYYEVVQYDKEMRKLRSVRYRSGADDLWYNDDDEIIGYTWNYYDDDGLLIGQVEFNSPGATGIWFDEFDEAESYEVYRRVRSEQVGILFAEHWLTGPDRRPKTNDDNLDFYQEHRSDSKGRETLVRGVNNPGADGQWYTGDDVTAGFEKMVYDPDGRRLSRTNFVGDGADGVFDSGDEFAQDHTDYIYDEDGKTYVTLYFNDSGGDGVFGGGDDTLLYEKTYYTSWKTAREN